MHICSRIESEEQLKKKLDFIYQESKKGKGFHGICKEKIASGQ